MWRLDRIQQLNKQQRLAESGHPNSLPILPPKGTRSGRFVGEI